MNSIENKIYENFKRQEKLCNELGVAKELYLKYGNVRIEVSNIEGFIIELDKLNPEFEEINNFVETDKFNELPFSVRKAVVNQNKQLAKEIDSIKRKIEEYKKYLKSY